MANKPFKMRLTIEDSVGRIVVEETVANAYGSERGSDIAFGLRRFRDMLAARYPGEFSETGGF